MDWNGKWYLITGGSSGMGLQTAKDLAEKGAHVILVGSNPGKLDCAIKQLPEGNRVICYDLRDLENIHRIFEEINRCGIVLDGMVYAAGVSPLMLVSDNDLQVMSDTFAINYFSFMEMAKYFQRRGTSGEKGSIVVISSIAASQSVNRQSVYAGSKAAVEAAIRCVAKELLLRGIRVNAVAPGAVRTEMFEALSNESSNLISRYPLGIIPMKKISDLITYLLSDESEYMTGSVIKMDAGHDVWLR